MKTWSSKVLGSAVVALALLQPSSASAVDGHTVLTPNDVTWGPGPGSLPKGAEAAAIYGDPSMEGPFALRLKLPKGYHIPPHSHPRHEIVTVLSGSLLLGEGDSADQSKTTTLSSGSFFAMPPGMLHYVYAGEETVLQLNSTGPWNIVYVNAKDDPRKDL